MAAALDRRTFLLGGLCGVGALARTRRPLPGSGKRTLVLIQLTGGNDGLSTLVPYSDDVYARARRATRFDPSVVLRIDERVGLHPHLTGLRALYERGHLGFIEGIGYVPPNRSHLHSLDIWQAADERGRGAGSGWIGRCVERLPDAAPHAAVHLGPRLPFSLYSAQRPGLCIEPGLLELVAPESSSARRAAEELGASPQSGSGNLALVEAALGEAHASLDALRHALARRTRTETYPPTPFAQRLRNAAALVHADVGVRVCSLEFGSWDTHYAQRERHDWMLRQFDAGLAAFAADLETSEAGREALVVLFSEFGRRVTENASGGTDHGSAGLALVLGARVRGGFHGRAPALDALDNGDLAVTTDFRSLYARCIRHVFELEPTDVLGAVYPPIEFL